CQQSRRSPPTF
nr:immunoglobulin light chain junction region [Macaca mulatta]MOY11265.1 immunoglobulin light chain junction region [Macaca mulatta]MOY11600.1 immunoglobulin light chain junction region [Macaca mulatta]MOY11818.1 immunoglobulin light chain junction region [Macaca mulatta]MOY12352.1 immunoglobulin light chain junction region [Macaca mulatta]